MAVQVTSIEAFNPLWVSCRARSASHALTRAAGAIPCLRFPGCEAIVGNRPRPGQVLGSSSSPGAAEISMSQEPLDGPPPALMHRILHMASFSRSGETLVLRCMNAHPDVHVVHQIRQPDERKDFALFRRLQTWPAKQIPHHDSHVRATEAKQGQVLLLKNAVWEHHFPFEGFILVRNPFSVFRSFGIIGEGTKGFLKRKEQFFRWAAGIDEELIELMKDPDNLTCLCMLYNRKMHALSRLGLPVLHYELFVHYPEASLEWLLAELGLPWSDRVLRSHEDYEEGLYGHGRIPLWKPIHTGSLDSYKRVPDALFRRIYGLTYPTLEAFGYEVEDGQVDVSREFYHRLGVSR